LAVAVELPADL